MTVSYDGSHIIGLGNSLLPETGVGHEPEISFVPAFKLESSTSESLILNKKETE